ncbi:MAG: hypothetical protein M3139_00095 [Bacteroidota bacterium]|nr:hypothetical protein [Bacteroidota bacterium]
MKKFFNRQFYVFLFSFAMLTLTRALVFAQDSAGGNSTTTSTTSASTTTIQPWMWIVGGVVLLIIIIALLRGNSNTTTGTAHTDKVTYTKTTSSED